MGKRGIALVIALTVVFVLGVMGSVFVARAVNESRIAKRYSNATRAFWMAEAGIQKADYELNTHGCVGLVQCGNTSTACVSCSSCGSTGACLYTTLSTNGVADGDYDISYAASTVTAKGYYPSRTSTTKAQRTIQVTIGSTSMFANAILSKGSIDINENVVIDSYNSSSGAYNAATHNSNGDVVSNGTSAGIINIDNNAEVYGDVATGASGTVTVGNGATVSGTTTHTTNTSISSVTVPASLTSQWSSGSISLGNGGTQTITAGNYKYSSISLANHATITISGNVSLYLTGAASLTTGNNANIVIPTGSSLTVYSAGTFIVSNNALINNQSNTPSKFLLYSTYTGSNGVQLENNGNFYGAVYAPDTDVVLSNNFTMFGAVVGETVSLSNNGRIHYDENLANQFPGAGYTLSSWQEL